MSETTLGSSEIAPWRTFPLGLPSRSNCCPIRLAFPESQFATFPLGAVFAVDSQCWNNFYLKQIACRRSRLIMGMPGGRIALAIRGGRRPRAGGAKPQEAALFFMPQAHTIRIGVIHKR